MLRIAVAKGRLAEDLLNLFNICGIYFDEYETSRKLLLHDRENNLEMILVKPIDTPVYVDSGAADCGIVGKDVLLENESDVYSLMALNISNCKMCVAIKKEEDIKNKKFITVATKYPHITKKYFDSIDIDCKIIKLSGAIELAPILNMSDAIVDIVQTGKTLSENGLIVSDIIIDNISACFIVNKVSLKTAFSEIEQLMKKLSYANKNILKEIK
jgi:ATP phosphoribosyltransferase